jgi:hypothetical protein
MIIAYNCQVSSFEPGLIHILISVNDFFIVRKYFFGNNQLPDLIIFGHESQTLI